MMSAIHNSLISIAFPAACLDCGELVEDAALGPACKPCWDATTIFSGCETGCRKCGASLGDERGPITTSCHQCRDHIYDSAAAIGVYEKALAASVISLKTLPRLSSRVRLLAKMALRRASARDNDLVVPTPLSKLRLNERGFNQAEIIASFIAKCLDLPVDTASLTRKTHTAMHRVGMDATARSQSVKDAFQVVRPNLISGKKILLIDDVLTSGATASSCAVVLKQSGARRVDVFTLARAVMR